MLSPRMQGWTLTLTAYTYTPKYIPGVGNAVTDALRRLPFEDNSLEKLSVFEAVNLLQHLQTSPVTSQRVRLWTTRDPILSQVKRALQQGWLTSIPPKLKPYSIRKMN